jgi:hypothetical protein
MSLEKELKKSKESHSKLEAQVHSLQGVREISNANILKFD